MKKVRRFVPIRKCLYQKIFWDPAKDRILYVEPDDPEPPEHFQEVVEKPVLIPKTNMDPVSMGELTNEMYGDQIKKENELLTGKPEAKATFKKRPGPKPKRAEK